MTEEMKNDEQKECKCCECREKLKEFFFKALIVYVGVTLAILTSATILKPKHGCPLKCRKAGIERQLPPPPMMEGGKKFHKMKHHRPDMQKPPVSIDKKLPQ